MDSRDLISQEGCPDQKEDQDQAPEPGAFWVHGGNYNMSAFGTTDGLCEVKPKTGGCFAADRDRQAPEETLIVVWDFIFSSCKI